MKMKIAAATVLTSLLWTACSMAKPVAPLRVELGSAFKLPVGGSAQIGDGILRVGVDAVLNDSRCPKGEQCVWAGDATVRVWLQQASGPRQALDLRLMANTGPTPQALGYQIRLLRLEPEAVSGKAIAPGDYLATLELKSAEAEGRNVPNVAPDR
ncbi:hypothetical protein [Paucibacter sp. KCTC 42545]|uniref:hypothetical protein n=1 Tax=Paucibacter sp. KCTC 42545 TaxID=1768242 RepID=UPI0012E33431|nr:hypothetical protein [Paucibacter sp. KCTC 42545]